MSGGRGPVRAAGGVVCRPAPGGPVVCLVHRPRYDDWSLPKGKLKKAEHPLAAAVREVAEETGVAAVPRARLASIGYELPDGVDKTVDYWVMAAPAGATAFMPNDEVDDLKWVPLAQAAAEVSYPHDADVLRQAAALPPVTATVLLVRHAYAGDRAQWSGPDRLRPLDEEGAERAAALAPVLALVQPRRVVSARPLRCRETVAPLADRLGVQVVEDGAFDEDADPGAAAAALRGLAAGGEPVVVCSQGKLIPPLLAALRGDGTAQAYATAKGGGWLLAFAGSALAAADRLGEARQ
ncbi:MAG TPA: NUDIX domain-containing protein [Pilimelia sp.]|nr:NUDIX domain-containing protein [Pilimelia sp.]